MPRRHSSLRLTVMFIVAITSCVSAVSGATAPDQMSDTHKQVRVIEPQVDGQRVSLTTFSMDRHGNLLLCCGPALRQSTTRPTLPLIRTGSASADPTGTIQVISPSGRVVRTIPLDFVPTAIDVDPAGDIFVAGNGQVRKLNADGKILATAKTPNIQDMAKLKEQLREEAKKRAEQSIAIYKKYVTGVNDRIKSLTEIPEERRTDEDKTRLDQYRRQLRFYSDQLKRIKDTASKVVNVDALIKSKLKVTGLAVSDRDLFICCPAATGYGYDVWRVDHQLQHPHVVLKQLRGCCGQMDIQCCKDDLVVAENTKFDVAVYDRDGKQQLVFGKRDRKSLEGFGSCCNPMNVHCCSNGDFLTAESSIGNIKRFDASGKLIARIGQARIGSGCKHCALAYDEKRDRYYMMHEDEHHICVLVPLSEAPGLTDEERSAREARDGLGKKLIGKWELVSAATSARPAVTLARTSRPPQSLDFAASGDFRISQSGSAVAVRASNITWEPVKQQGDTLEIVQITDQVRSRTWRIEFLDDNTAKITALYGTYVYGTGTYRRAESD